MENEKRASILVKVIVDEQLEKVWAAWNKPEHITKWYFASNDWHAPYAENDLRPHGKLLIRMEAKDKSFGFDFYGFYDEIKHGELINLTLGDERKVNIQFIEKDNKTEITEVFEAENENSIELQKSGWQAILDQFKKYVENLK